MTGTIFLGGTARRTSSGARSQVCRSVSGPTRRPSCALAWGGLAEGNSSVQQAEASVVSQESPGGHLAKGNQSVQQAKVTGLRARARRGLGPRAWGRGLQGLGAGPPEVRV